MFSIFTPRAAASPPPQPAVAERPAIVLVAFGTTDEEARKVFDHIEAAAKRRYPDHDIRWGFTSEFVLEKLKQQGLDVKSVAEVIEDLKKDGHTTAVLQSLHVAPGQEFNELQQIKTPGLRLAVGRALLADDDDIRAVVGALGGEIKKDSANVVVCHGNRRHPEFNRQLVALAKAVEARYDNVVVCSINGQPGTDGLVKARCQAARSAGVHFIPMMLVAGVHVADDILGDGPESWKSVVGAEETTCARPLGYNDKVFAVFFEHVDEALAELHQQAEAKDRP